MTPTTTPPEVLKLDRIGRARFSPEFREQLLDAYESSALSGPEFAKSHGVKYQTFATWVQKRRSARNEEGSADAAAVLSSLVEVHTEGTRLLASAVGGSASLEIELPGRSRLKIDTPEQARLAAALLLSLDSATPC